MILEVFACERSGKGYNGAELAQHMHSNSDFMDFVRDRPLDDSFRRSVRRMLNDLTEHELLIKERDTDRWKLNLENPPIKILHRARASLAERLMPVGLYAATECTTPTNEEDGFRNTAQWERFKKTSFYQWTKKFRVINHNCHAFKQYEDIGDHIYNTINKSLYLERKLKITYQPPGKDWDPTYYFSPVGLVIYRATPYLIGKAGGSDKSTLVMLRVSRIIKAELSNYPISDKCRHFDLDTYIESGFFEFGDQAYDLNHPQGNRTFGRSRIVLKIHKDELFDQTHRQLRACQRLDPANNIIEFESYLSPELEKWILSETPWIEVLEPEELRKSVRWRLEKGVNRG
jgi:hypothetical protein